MSNKKRIQNLSDFGTVDSDTYLAADKAGRTEAGKVSMEEIANYLANNGLSGDATKADKTFQNTGFLSDAIIVLPSAVSQASNVITVPSGTSILFSNSKSGGLMQSTLYTLPEDKTYAATSEAASAGNYVAYINTNGVIAAIAQGSWYEQDNAPTPSTAHAIWKDTANNIMKETTNTGANWTQILIKRVAYFTTDGTNITALTSEKAFAFSSQQIIAASTQRDWPSWYILYSNGFLVQGGRLKTDGTNSYTFPIPFKTGLVPAVNVNGYSTQGNASTNAGAQILASEPSNAGFTINGSILPSYVFGGWWEAKGFKF